MAACNCPGANARAEGMKRRQERRAGRQENRQEQGGKIASMPRTCGTGGGKSGE